MQAVLKRQRNRQQGSPLGVDWIFVGVVLLLTLLGLLMAYSTTFFWSYTDYAGNPFAIFARQLGWTALGLLAFAGLSWLDYGYLKRVALPILGVTLLALLATVVVGTIVFGARRTLVGGSIHPSEIAKVAIAIYAGAWLASRQKDVQSIADGLLPFGAIIGIVSFFIAIQPDLSTTLVIVLMALTMFFMAGASWPQIIGVGLIAVAAFVVMMLVFPHAQDRWQVFTETFRNPAALDGNYHMRQITLTIGSAGLFGHGLGASYQKFGILPTPHTDSVLAVLADEMGLIGLFFSLALFAAFAWRGFVIAQRANTAFGAFVAIGVTIWVLAQALMNVLSVLAMIPFTGLPVPFLSVGGSSMVSLLIGCGILVSISRGSRLPEHASEPVDDEQPVARTRRTVGANAFHASTSLRRRNSRTRVARAKRAAGAERFVGDSTVVGQDIRFSARLGRRKPTNGIARRGVVRWRG
jgi:cell division protein FtsW